MKTGLVPILVTVKRGIHDGRKVAQYPDFNQVPADIRFNTNWPIYIDVYGIGWHYDKIENIGLGSDQEIAGTCVPNNFAQAAATLFPDRVRIVSEQEFADFWEQRSKIYEETQHLDTDVLQGINARVQLELAGIAPPPGPEIESLRKLCLDPSDQTHRGIRKNLKKKWSDAKVALCIELQ